MWTSLNITDCLKSCEIVVVVALFYNEKVAHTFIASSFFKEKKSYYQNSFILSWVSLYFLISSINFIYFFSKNTCPNSLEHIFLFFASYIVASVLLFYQFVFLVSHILFLLKKNTSSY